MTTLASPCLNRSRVEAEFWATGGQVRRDGHILGGSIAARLVLRSKESPSGCWLWLGNRGRGGYGQIKVGRSQTLAHRTSYETFVGPIPEGLTVDHLCFRPACINPEHLRLLTASENSRNQRKASADACARGHAWTPENTFHVTNGDGQVSRGCRACRKASAEAFAERRRERLAAGELEHGTGNAYEGGCRCESCRAWRHAAYQRTLARKAAS